MSQAPNDQKWDLLISSSVFHTRPKTFHRIRRKIPECQAGPHQSNLRGRAASISEFSGNTAFLEGLCSQRGKDIWVRQQTPRAKEPWSEGAAAPPNALWWFAHHRSPPLEEDHSYADSILLCFSENSQVWLAAECNINRWHSKAQPLSHTESNSHRPLPVYEGMAAAEHTPAIKQLSLC